MGAMMLVIEFNQMTIEQLTELKALADIKGVSLKLFTNEFKRIEGNI